MVYKFNTGKTGENADTYIELSRDKESLMLVSGDYENEINGNFHYLKEDEIDDLLIALTNIQNEISQWKKKQV